MNTFQGLVTSDFWGIEIGGGFVPSFFISTDGGRGWAIAGTDGGAGLQPNHWHHLAGTYDGAKLQFYMDGQPRGRPVFHTGRISPMTTNSGVSFGSEERRAYSPLATQNRYFKGLIDEVAVYNRALSAEEIAALERVGRESLAKSLAEKK
jgi:hypothetical protein